MIFKDKKEMEWLDNYKPVSNLQLYHHQQQQPMGRANLNQHEQHHHNHQQQQQQYSIRATASETFKLVEKAQPKKSRTKYTKEQVI